MATSRLRRGLIRAIEAVHFRLFRHPMGEQMRQFFGNLSWSFLGGGLASAVMLVVNILAGRLIGPEGFGRYNLVLTFSQLLMLPLIFSLDIAGVRSVAMSKNREEEASNISSALYFLAANSLFITLLFLLSYRFIALRFAVDTRLLFLIIAMTLTMSFRNVCDGFIRALGLYEYQFRGRIAEVVVAVSIFALLFFGVGRMNEFSYILALLAGGVTLTLIFFGRLTPYLTTFSYKHLSAQLSYGKILLIGSILGTAFNSLDVVIIARYLSVFEVGIYGAYYAASTNLVAQLVQMFINVFFPSVAKAEDKRAIFQKVNQLSVLAFVPCVIILSGMVWLIISLFGSKYGVRLNYVLEFGTLGSLIILVTVYASLLTAISEKLYKKYLIWLNGLSLLHVGYYALMIYFRLTSIQTIVAFIILYNFAIILIQKGLITQHYRTAEA